MEGERTDLRTALPSEDARDYFPQGVVEKFARSIDTNGDHRWEETHGDTVLLRRDGVAVVEGIAENPDGTSTLLTAIDNGDGTFFAAEASAASRKVANRAVDLAKLASRHCPGELMARCAEAMSQHLASASADDLAQTTALLEGFFSALPKDPDAMPLDFVPDLPEQHKDGPPSADQQEAFQRVLRAASAVLPPELFARRLHEFYQGVPRTAFAYRQYFPFLLQEMAEWAVKERKEYGSKYGTDEVADLVTRFSPDKSVTRQFATQDDAQEFLQTIAVEPLPPLHALRERKPREPQIVALNDVVGGIGVPDWTRIDTVEDRGMTKVWTLMQEMRSGTRSDFFTPIKVAKYQDKYYVDGDGRHRVAAMKALGIDRAPMMVLEYEG